MEIQERVRLLAIEEPRECDFCHARTDVRYLDHDTWACGHCAHLYLAQLHWKG